jgi:hypothetical protein
MAEFYHNRVLFFFPRFVARVPSQKFPAKVFEEPGTSKRVSDSPFGASLDPGEERRRPPQTPPAVSRREKLKIAAATGISWNGLAILTGRQTAVRSI